MRSEKRRCRFLRPQVPAAQIPADQYEGEDYVREKSSSSRSLECIGRSARPLSAATRRRIEELRRNIALLDEASDLERDRLEQEQHAVDERRRAQEVFESTIWEQVERDIRANEARGVQEEAEWRRRV